MAQVVKAEVLNSRSDECLLPGMVVGPADRLAAVREDVRPVLAPLPPDDSAGIRIQRYTEPKFLS